MPGESGGGGGRNLQIQASHTAHWHDKGERTFDGTPNHGKNLNKTTLSHGKKPLRRSRLSASRVGALWEPQMEECGDLTITGSDLKSAKGATLVKSLQARVPRGCPAEPRREGALHQ